MSRTFDKVRDDHSRETAEDYVEAISDIVHEHGECRVRDLSRHMGVSHVTVSRTVGRLEREELVATEPHRPIRLTAQGEQLAAESRRRHRIVLAFLLAIGVPRGDAERDAEGIEHHAGDTTLACMTKYLRKHGSTIEVEHDVT